MRTNLQDAARRWRTDPSERLSEDFEDVNALADFAASLLDETPVTPERLLAMGFEDFDSGFRNEKLLGLGCIRVLFIACEGPLCWRVSCIEVCGSLGGVVVQVQNTVGGIKALCFALGITLKENERE